VIKKVIKSFIQPAPGVIHSADIVPFCIVTLLILRESSQNQKKRSFQYRAGKTTEAHPKCLKKGDAGIAVMLPSKPMCVETFVDYLPLRTFAVCDMKQTVAGGKKNGFEKGNGSVRKVTKATQKTAKK
jgi:translation elongation factor EF-1alpha